MIKILKALKRRIYNIPQVLSWYLPYSRSKEYRKRISRFKNIHSSERCFIIANGPSLQKTDLSLLKNEITIGMNRIYLLKNTLGFSPNYTVVDDIEIQLKQFQKEYDAIKGIKFFPWAARKLFTKKENLFFYKMGFPIRFSPKFTGSIGAGKSVTVVCLQLAFYMGFKEVILIGKDHYYKVEQAGSPGKRILSNGKEENHFIKGYYKPGMKWTVPNYSDEEKFYHLAKKSFERDGRIILDATIDGKLTVFNKVNYKDLF